MTSKKQKEVEKVTRPREILERFLAGERFSDSIERIEAYKNEEVDENTSDGYHTFKELYEFRLLYNAAWFNELANKLVVYKSKKHDNGELCFGGGWFIVVAELPTGQISNHYESKDWDLFQCEEKEIADEWDGHTPKDVADRIRKYLNS